MFSRLKEWLFSSPPSALPRMRLGPEGNRDNPLMLQFFTWDALNQDMSWWRHFHAEIPKLAQMGFTQVWLPPPNKAAEKSGRGYDAYDLWDLGEFEHKGAIATRAREHGIDILIDAVLNHKLGADKVEKFQAIPSNPQNRLKDAGPVREIEGWTRFEYPGRNGKYSTFQWNQEHFTGVDWDHKTRERGIYRIVGSKHKGWSRHVDTELGNYDFLLGVDIDHRHPEVQKDLLAWGQWVLETTGATGFRLDAIKHMDRRFLLKFIEKTRAAPGNKRMFAVCTLKLLLPYIRAFKGETAFFDVPLHMNFNQASRQRARYDLRNVLKETVLSIKPNDAVTFVEGQSLESWVDKYFKIQAYTLILLRGPGYPCVFYGDLYPNQEGYDENTAKNLTMLIEARKKFAYGTIQDYQVDKNCIGFVRTGDSEHDGCAVLLSNKEDHVSVWVVLEDS
ncbi:glycoside hydrolase family 13 protein [Infundibulicybe gibba]|nr:glycoside hydrolase family 13 protein [Infundibulicybe gibba]